jgi:hypothetical protein
MARYCFYCNKELQPGQSCDCRHARKIHGEATDDHASAPADEPQPATGNVADAANTNDGATAEPKARRSRRRSRRTDSPRQTSGIPRANGFRQAFAFLLNFFKDPIGAAKQQTRYSNLRVFGLILMEAVFSGFFVYNALFRSSLGQLLLITTVRPTTGFNTLFLFLFSFLAGFLISLFQYFLRTLCFYATGFILLKRRLEVRRILDVQVPSCIFYMIFLLAGTFSATATGISSILLLMAAMAMRSLMDYVAWKEYTGQSESRVLYQIAAITLLQCIILGALISSLLPNITNFSFSKGFL